MASKAVKCFKCGKNTTGKQDKGRPVCDKCAKKTK